jgi:hypothetical protein
MNKQPKPIEREYLGVGEAETLTGRSRWTWRRDAYQGRIASVKVGRRLLIPVAEIRRVMSEGLRPAVPEAQR